MLKKYILFLSLIISANTLSAQKQHLKMTLEEVIETAREQSPSALMAKHNFLADYWQFRSYKAQLLPSLNLNASLGQYNRSLRPLQNTTTGEINYIKNNNLNNSLSLYIHQNIAATGGSVSVTTSLNRLDQFSPSENILYNSQPISFSYSQPIMAYNSLKWEKVTEPKRYESAKRTYLANIEDINTTVTSLFFNVLAAQMALEMAEKNYSSTELASKIAKERYEIGSMSNSDLLQLKLRLINDKLAISDNRLALDLSMLQLQSYLGFNENVELELILPKEGPDVQLDFEEVYAKASENSAYTIDNELKIISAEQEVARARSSAGLQAQFNAQFGLTQKGNNLSQSYNNPMDQEVVGLSLSLPILDWGLGKGKVKLAKSREEVIRTQVEQSYSQYKQDILIKVMQFNKQSMQCSTSAQADSIAQLRYNIALERFQNSTINVTDLNTAQSEKDNAAKRYIADLSSYWQSYFTIRKISLYDYLNNRKVSAEFDKMIDN